MKKSIFFVLMLAMVITACNNTSQQKSTTEDTEKTQLETFAVVWSWNTWDKEHIERYIGEQSDQTMALWEDGVIENVYFSKDTPFIDSLTFPTITFFIKAKDKKAAEKILDEQVVVKQSISYYTLYPVGMNWIQRKEGVNPANAYVVIWENLADATALQENGKEQMAKIVEFWEEGIIENGYLDAKGIAQGTSDRPPVVFFVNADTEAEASAYLDQLVFVQKDLATYKLHPVGMFWMGKSE